MSAYQFRVQAPMQLAEVGWLPIARPVLSAARLSKAKIRDGCKTTLIFITMRTPFLHLGSQPNDTHRDTIALSYNQIYFV